MKRIKIISVTIALLLIPLLCQVQSAPEPAAPPPVAPSLVRQGDFAISLLEVFELGIGFSEEQAQEMLAEIGIEPKSGWITDYPVTPDIIGELQDSVEQAAKDGYLTMNPSEAVNIFQNLVADYGLPVIPGNNHTVYGESPPSAAYNYTQPFVINNYYYHNGPPVVTYYPPPYGYYNLYSWVPYSFWCGGFWFSGFFILNDFHRSSHVVILIKYGHKSSYRSHKRVIGVISNHAKKYRHAKKNYVIKHSKRKFGGRGYPEDDAIGRRWYKPHKPETDNRASFLRQGIEQRRIPADDDVIRGDKRYNVRSLFNRSTEEKHRGAIKEYRNRRSFKVPGRVNQPIENDIGRPQVDNTSPKIRRPDTGPGFSANVPRKNGLTENRSNTAVRKNRDSVVRENRNPVAIENRKSLNRSFGGTRFFQGREPSSFQTFDRSGPKSLKSWNRVR
ncbi:MAG: hypothetical protein R6U27_13040 [Desulfobacterales bacterium]